MKGQSAVKTCVEQRLIRNIESRSAKKKKNQLITKL